MHPETPTVAVTRHAHPDRRAAVAVVLIRRQWDLSLSDYLQRLQPLGWSSGAILGRLLIVVYIGACAAAVGAVTFLAIRVLRSPAASIATHHPAWTSRPAPR